MTSRIKAIQAYRPRIKQSGTVQLDALVAHISARSVYNKGDIVHILAELHEAIVWFNSFGQGVKLEGIGTYLPNIRLDGTLDVQHRLDWGLRRELNNRKFDGKIINRNNIGKTADELVALWNEEHPEDPVPD
jgi:hypothetical protein